MQNDVSDRDSTTRAGAARKSLPGVDSPRKGSLSRISSLHEQCRVCQQEKEEVLIDLGCKCKGGLAKAHRTCIDTWFSRRGSNKMAVAVNVSPPESQPSVGVIVVLGLGTALRLALDFCIKVEFLGDQCRGQMPM
ncbi:hypothetical protein D5086_003801 [Populus alba]|uniref:Uncharacterized protein n=1 Tax=Populus alba TaxID=43335 RepID=A0ACC4D5C3_POPAL